MFSKILVAVDLDDLPIIRAGLSEAVKLAETSQGVLRLVNIQPLFLGAFIDYMPKDLGSRQEILASHELELLMESINFPKERSSFKIRTGGVYNEILAEAKEFLADLIVIGSHRPNMSNYLLGSNSTAVVRHAKCSVLVIRS